MAESKLTDPEGRRLWNGTVYRCTWTGSGYDVHRDEQSFWLGVGNIPAGRPWTEEALRSDVVARFVY
jgi:hypothetical protein